MEKSVNSAWYTLSLRCFWDNKIKLFHCQWSKGICDQEKGFGKEIKICKSLTFIWQSRLWDWKRQPREKM